MGISHKLLGPCRRSQSLHNWPLWNGPLIPQQELVVDPRSHKNCSHIDLFVKWMDTSSKSGHYYSHGLRHLQNLRLTFAYMPTLLDYPGVSQIRHRSPALPYGSPNLPDKIIFWAFVCLSLWFSPLLAQNLNFSYLQYNFWGILHVFSHWERVFLASKRWLTQ